MLLLRRICTIFTFALLTLVASHTMRAQNPPVLLSFQGVLLTPSGALFPTQQAVITIKLFYSEDGNDIAWQDDITTLIEKGVFNIILGEQIPLDAVDFSRQLWVEISLPGAQPYQKRTKLTASPCSYSASCWCGRGSHPGCYWCGTIAQQHFWRSHADSVRGPCNLG